MKRSEKIFLFSLFLTVITVLALLPTDPKSEALLSQPSPVDWGKVIDDPAEKHRLWWQGIISHATGKEGSWIERNLEERFNVELTPLFLDGNAYEKRRPLMLVGGDVPDVMWSGDPIALRANLRNGFIMEIPYDVILEHCPTYVAHVNHWGKEAWLYTQKDGRNYGLPTIDSAANRPRIGAWRWDWLTNVGITKVPETLEEMDEAMRKLRNDDPDGNGKRDTYGWSPNVSHWSLLFAEIFAANDVLAFDFMEHDGEVVWGGLLPGARETLQLLHTWYKEGLLDPGFPVDTQGRKVESNFINGKVGYCYPIEHYHSFDPNDPSSLIGKTRAFHPDAEIRPAPPFRNRQDERRGRTWGGAAHIIQFGKHLEHEPEKVIRVLKMMEEIAKSEELYLESQCGKRGQHWEYFPAPFTDSYGRPKPAGIHAIPPYDDESRKRETNAELLGGRCRFYFPCSLEQIYELAYMDPTVRKWYENNRASEWGLMNVLGKSDVVTSSGRYLKDLERYQISVYIEMVTGERPISEFGAFVREWKRRGGDVVLAEANTMYQQMHEIFTRVGVTEAQR